MLSKYVLLVPVFSEEKQRLESSLFFLACKSQRSEAYRVC